MRRVISRSRDWEVGKSEIEKREARGEKLDKRAKSQEPRAKKQEASVVKTFEVFKTSQVYL
jgi:hypothetical protein